MLLYHTVYTPLKWSVLLNTCETISDKQSTRTRGHACSSCSSLRQDDVPVLPSEHGRTGTSGRQSYLTLQFFPLNRENVHRSYLQRRQVTCFQHPLLSKSQNTVLLLKNGISFAPICAATSAGVCQVELPRSPAAPNLESNISLNKETHNQNQCYQASPAVCKPIFCCWPFLCCPELLNIRRSGVPNNSV